MQFYQVIMSCTFICSPLQVLLEWMNNALEISENDITDKENLI